MARRSLAIVAVLLLVLATAPVAFAAESDPDVTAAITLDPAEIPETTPAGTSVGALAVADPEVATVFTLVAGEGDTHNHLFVVDGAAVVTAAELDFESLGSELTIRIAAGEPDGDTTVEEVIGITLQDAPEITLVPSDIDENVEPGSQIGILTAGEPEGETGEAELKYSLVEGDGDEHNHLFLIDGDQLLTAAELDFEELGPSLTIRVAATDLGTDTVVLENRLFIVLNDFELEITAVEQEILDALLPACDPIGDDFVLLRFPQLDPNTRFSYSFGDDRAGGERRHRGADLMGTKGMPVVAVADGVVSYVGTGVNAGHFVIVQHDDGWESRYMHLNNDSPGTDDGLLTREEALAPGVTVGTEVLAGQLLGWVGDSGNAENSSPHTHFELWQRRHLANPFACLGQAWGWQQVTWGFEGRIL
jgi:hypothetical protein